MSAQPVNRKRIIRLYYLFQFTFTLLFWTPVFFEYQKRMGLTDPEIFRIQSLYYVLFCLFELPTGYFADRFGYVKSMAIGAVLLVLANVSAIYFVTFAGFLIHWGLVAAARSFVSGASSAYLFEYLRRADAHAEFKQIEGNARAYSLFGRVLCFAVIGYVMAWHVALPYWLTAVSALIAFGLALLLPALGGSSEARGGTGAGISRLARPKLSLRVALDHVSSSPKLLALMFQGVVIFVLARVVSVNLFQPILHAKGFGIEAYGLVMAGMTLIEAVGSARPNWLRARMSDIHAVFLLSVIMGLSVLLLPFFASTGTLVLFAVFSIVTGLSYPIQKQVMNEAIPDPEYRATILSLESLIDRAVTAGVAATIERMTDRVDSFLLGVGAVSIAMMVLVQMVVSRPTYFTSVIGKKRVERP